MAYPVFEEASTISARTATSVLVNYPATVNANDILVIAVRTGGSGDWTTPSGWTRPGSYDNRSTFWKRATGSESGTIQVDCTASGAQYGVMYRFSGCVETGDPLEGFVETSYAASSTVNIEDLASNTGGTDRLCCAVTTVVDDLTGNDDASNYSEADDQTSGFFLDSAFHLYTNEQFLPGKPGADSYTMSGSAGRSLEIFALVPSNPTVIPYPVYEDVGTFWHYAGASPGNALYFYAPAGEQAGDIMLLALSQVGGTYMNLPSGWTSIWYYTAGGVPTRFCWKRSTGSGSSGSTIGDAGTAQRWSMMARISGCVATGTPFDTVGTQWDGYNTTVNIPTVTTAGDIRLCFHMVSPYGYNINANDNASEYSEVFEGTYVGNGAVFGYSYGKYAAGVVAADSYTMSTPASKAGVTIPLIPALGYANDVLGVAAANIGKIMGVDSANIAKVNGV